MVARKKYEEVDRSPDLSSFFANVWIGMEIQISHDCRYRYQGVVRNSVQRVVFIGCSVCFYRLLSVFIWLMCMRRPGGCESARGFCVQSHWRNVPGIGWYWKTHRVPCCGLTHPCTSWCRLIGFCHGWLLSDFDMHADVMAGAVTKWIKIEDELVKSRFQLFPFISFISLPFHILFRLLGNYVGRHNGPKKIATAMSWGCREDSWGHVSPFPNVPEVTPVFGDERILRSLRLRRGVQEANTAAHVAIRILQVRRGWSHPHPAEMFVRKEARTIVRSWGQRDPKRNQVSRLLRVPLTPQK